MAERRICVMHPRFREDLTYWTGVDRRIALRLLRIMEETLREPFLGIGKPEAVKYLGSDAWSRRLTDEHRVVYTVHGDRIDFLQARFHYER